MFELFSVILNNEKVFRSVFQYIYFMLNLFSKLVSFGKSLIWQYMALFISADNQIKQHNDRMFFIYNLKKNVLEHRPENFFIIKNNRKQFKHQFYGKFVII